MSAAKAVNRCGSTRVSSLERLNVMEDSRAERVCQTVSERSGRLVLPALLLGFGAWLGLAGCSTGSPPGDTASGGALGIGGGSGGAAEAGTGGVTSSAGGAVASGGLNGSGSGGVLENGSGGGLAAGGSVGDGGANQGSGGGDTVTRTSGTYDFRHFPVQAGDDGVWSGPDAPSGEAVTTTFETIVLENGFLKVTLLPEYGGRILSIVHKASGKELLYQNPIGTPYLMNEEIFYYDYLVILGGIFPSFPEPEHGKYWNLPYQVEIVTESPEAITVRMSRQDDRERAPGVPNVYDVGRTDLLVELEVTLRAGRANLELTTKLTNTRSTALSSFEYWTVTTLAPGSVPGDTKIPENTRILADMDQVRLLESSWAWFGNAETRVSGEVFEWENLSFFKNWVDQGTAFANPSYEANWSGLINYENDIGVLRVTEGGGTEGLKLWTFGTQSLTADLNDSAEWLRPTIEMWHGVTPEFWDRGSMAAGEVRTWKDNYFATLGMKEVTAASEYGAVYLSRLPDTGSPALDVLACLTVPGRSVRATLRLGDTVIYDKDLLVPASGTLGIEVSGLSADAPSGTAFSAEFRQGDLSLISAEIILP